MAGYRDFGLLIMNIREARASLVAAGILGASVESWVWVDPFWHILWSRRVMSNGMYVGTRRGVHVVSVLS